MNQFPLINQFQASSLFNWVKTFPQIHISLGRVLELEKSQDASVLKMAGKIVQRLQHRLCHSQYRLVWHHCVLKPSTDGKAVLAVNACLHYGFYRANRHHDRGNSCNKETHFTGAGLQSIIITVGSMSVSSQTCYWRGSWKFYICISRQQEEREWHCAWLEHLKPQNPS